MNEKKNAKRDNIEFNIYNSQSFSNAFGFNLINLHKIQIQKKRKYTIKYKVS